MDKEKEAELREKHGDLLISKIAGVEFAFQTPTDTDHEEYLNKLVKAANDKGKLGPAYREYCLRACVHPGPDELAAAFMKQPAAAQKVGDALEKLAGADVEITVKKG